MLTLVMKLAPVPTLTAACSPFEVAKAALMPRAANGKCVVRSSPRATYSAKNSAACPATREDLFRRLTTARVQLALSPRRPLLAGPVSEIPLVSHAPCVVPTRRHHALFVRGEAAVGGTAVVDTPWTINFGNARARINHGQCGKDEQGKGGADHSESPNCPSRPIDHSPGPLFPSNSDRAARAAPAQRQGWPGLAVVMNWLLEKNIRGLGFERQPGAFPTICASDR